MATSYDGDIRLSVSLDPKDAVKAADQLTRKIDDIFKSTAGKPMDDKFKKLQLGMDKTVAKADALRDKLLELQTMDNRTPAQEAAYSKLSAQLGMVNNQMRMQIEQAMGYMSTQTEMATSTDELTEAERQEADEVAEVIQAMIDAENSTNSAAASVKNFAKNLLAIAVSPVSGVLSSLSDKIRGVGKSSEVSGVSVGKLFRNLLRYGLGIRSLFFLFNRLRSAIKEGFANLQQFNGGSNSVATTINNLQASLTTLKNAWAAAFAPILQFVAPILQTLINMLISAANAIASFFAALGGQTKVIKATKAQQGLGKAIGGTGKAAEKAKGQLADFDELNIIGTDDSSGGGGGGGAGGGLGFEEETIGSRFKDMAELFKKSWEEADFTEIGTIVGTKIKEALDVAYEFLTTTAKDFAWRLARSIATFLNGVIEVDGLGESFGKTLGAAINVGFEFVNTFLREFHWDSLGSLISEGVQSMFEEFDWGNITQFLSLRLMAIFDFIRGVIQGIDWTQIPQDAITAVTEFVQGIDFVGIFTSLGELLGAAMTAGIDLTGAIVKLLAGALEDIVSYFDEWIKKAEEMGGNWFDGIILGILNAIANIGTWIYNNVFKPIVEGFMDAFDMHSPSKVMEELGRNIILGLFDGVANLVHIVIEKFEEFKNNVVELFTNIKSNVLEIWSNIKTSVITAATTLKENVVTAVTNLKTSVNNLFSNIKTTALNIWNGIKSSISRIVENIKTSVSTAFTNIKTTATNLVNGTKTNIVNTWNAIKSSITTIITNIKNGMINTFNAMKTTVVGIWNGLKTSATNIFSSIWNGIKGHLNKVIGGVETFANGAVRGINKVISSMNSLSFSVPDWVPYIGGSTFGLNLGQIGTISLPRLAEGGVIPPNKEFLAVLGDQKSGTNIEAPLETIKDAVRSVLNEGGGNIDELLRELISVVESKNLTISEQEITRASKRGMTEESRRTGRQLLME